MSKPNVHQKTILNLLSDTKADFLIPDYQRPYAWNQDQCQTLWDDLLISLFLVAIMKNLIQKRTNISLARS